MQKQTRRGSTLPGYDPAESKRMARMWPDFVKMEKRMGKEVPFIMANAPNQKPLVFDACLGCGATTIGLRLKSGASVVPNEIDPDMLDVAISEARKRDIRIRALSHDWRSIPSHLQGMFDMVTCLGNSLTLIFEQEGRLRALRNFASLLSPKGALVIDERNYPRILEGRFSQSGEYVYCGIDKVACRVVHADETQVIMEYEHLQSGDRALLRMYPFKRGELHGLLREAGFENVRTFGDYQERFSPDNVEFFTYVARVR